IHTVARPAASIDPLVVQRRRRPDISARLGHRHSANAIMAKTITGSAAITKAALPGMAQAGSSTG
ncbi:MAG: hypothetical protein ACRCY3_12620, partial [Sphingorhabdus sp.]